MVVLASSGLWLRSLRGPRWRDPGAREAGLGGGRGPSGVPGGAPRDRPRVCGGGIPRPCFPGGPAVPEVSPRAAASAGSRVPLPVCALFPARRPPILSSPRAAHRLDVGWWPRLGPNPAPPCWGRRRRPLVGPVSASPGARLRDRVGGAPRGARWASRRVSGGRPVARVRGKRGCRGTGRDCGGGGGGAAGSAEGRSAAPGAARGRLPARRLPAVRPPRVCPGRGRLRPRGPVASPSPPAAFLAPSPSPRPRPWSLVFSRPALPSRVGASPGCASLPGPAVALPGGVRPGRRRRGERVLPAWRCPVRRARAPERGPVVPPGQAFVRCVAQVGLRLCPVARPFPGSGGGARAGASAPVAVPRPGWGRAVAGRLRSSSLGRRVACATPAPAPAGGARSRASAGLRALDRTGARALRPARRDCPRAGRRGPPLARRPNVGAAPRGGRSAVPASPPPTGAGRARVRVAAGPSRARVGPSASSRAGATRKGLAGPWCEPGAGRWSCRVGGRVVGASGSPRPAPAPTVPAAAAPRPLAPSRPPVRGPSVVLLASGAPGPSSRGPRPAGRPRRGLAALLPTWLILPVAYACLKD